ncbi:PAS domain S-box protein [archaeon]|nr:PAS domain S-box protein [archaeon]
MPAIDPGFQDSIYRKLVDQNLEPVSIIKAGKIIYANKALAELVGINNPQELLGTNSFRWALPQDADRIKRYAQDRLEGKDAPRVYSFSIKSQNNEIKIVEAKVDEIEINGEPLVLIQMKDITQIVESERRFENLLNLAPVSIMTFSLLGYATSCNRATVELTGYDEDEIVGKHLTQLGYLSRKTAIEGVKYISQILQGKAKMPYPFAYRTKKGEDRWAQAYYRVIDRPTGGKEILGIIEDITEFRNLLASIQESEKQLRDFIRSASDVLYLYDEDLKLVDASESGYKLIKEYLPSLPVSSYIGKHLLEIVPNLEKVGRYTDFIKLKKTGSPIFYEDIQNPLYGDRWWSVKAFKVGEGIGIISRDITDSKIIEEKLVESERNLQSKNNIADIFLNLPDNEIYRGVLNLIREEFESPYGIVGLINEDGDLVQETFTKEVWNVCQVEDKTPVFTHDNWVGIFDTALNKKQPARINSPFTVPMGHIPITRALISPIIFRDKMLGCLLVGNKETDYTSKEEKELVEIANYVAPIINMRIQREQLIKQLIEERVRAEHAEEMERIKSNLMNTATHEIRTPMTSILGYSEIIREKLEQLKETELVNYFEVLERNIKRLDVLSSDLLDIQRIELGRMELNKSNVLVENMLNQVEAELNPILSEKHQDIEVTNKAQGTSVLMDELRIIQVLINLIGNASKFSDKNSRIEVITEKNQDKLVFKIVDEGIGLSREDIDKLFQPFPDIHIPNVSHGSGLGLSVCKGIVELHDGEIWAESKGRGKGSTFSFTLPLN